MRLLRAEIKNFRSVASLTVNFTTRCRTLVGINESGKTNILRALALLDPSRKPTPEDLRDFLPDEDHDQEAYVRFVFALDKGERRRIMDQLQRSVLTGEPDAEIISERSRALSLNQFCDLRGEGLHEIDVRTGARTFNYWRLPAHFAIVGSWCKPSATCPPNVVVTTQDARTVPLSSFTIVQASAVPEDARAHLKPLTPADLNAAVGQQVSRHVQGNLPKCLYWSYSDSQLLPAQVSLDGFALNPDSCEPLKQMFVLAGISPIGGAIGEAKKRPHGVRNLLSKVATIATKHLRNVWKDSRGVTIALEPNGPYIDASVRDTFNAFQFEKRSDGFKRFVTFLLLVSAKARTDDLVDTLYLQDEPDTGLHPSGSRYLRDELIRIAKTNYVVFSTHSIFMIDREEIGRHLIVEKKGEVTRVREVDESNITEEEVIYNALGYSLFENLRPQNLIFEGYKDKALFRTALRAASPKAKEAKKSFDSVGLCHAKGVKDIGRITPLLELAGRQWIVLSDCDQPAREQQRSYRGACPWFRYDELLPDTIAVTGEDFLKPEVFGGAVRVIEAEYGGLPPFDPARLRGSDSKLEAIKKWLREGGLSPEKVKEALDKIKDRVFADLKPAHVADEYFDLLGELAKRLQELKTSTES